MKIRARITGALVATAALAAASLMTGEPRKTPMETLVAATPRDARSIDARLSGGFAWAPYDGRTHQRPSPAVLNVLVETRGRTDPPSLHAAGVANLLLGNDSDAVNLLGRAAHLAPGSDYLSDYAAALMTLAEDQPQHWVDALVQVDHALDLDKRHAAALFNRAVIIEKLGLRTPAYDAWHAYGYLVNDRGTEWAKEAGTRLRRSNRNWVASFAVRRNQVELQPNDGDGLLRLVADFKEDSRRWATGPSLANWAELARKGKPAAAARELEFARGVGKALLFLTGDPLVVDAVAAIDGATAAQRQRLIEAHLRYRTARLASYNGSDAKRLLMEAAAMFDPIGSPMAFAAQYHIARTLYEQGRHAEATTILRGLNESQDARRYPSLIADVHLSLGLCEIADGNWSVSLAAFRYAEEQSAALDNRSTAAWLHSVMANTYASIGNRERAWQERIIALRMFSEDEKWWELITIICAAARDENWAGRSETALSLLKLAPQRDPMTRIEVYRARASTLASRGDRDDALNYLERGRVAANYFAWPVQQYAERAFAIAEAEIIGVEHPAHALALLDRAKASLTQDERRRLLPRVELQRARVLRRLDRNDQAAAALVSGIEAVEQCLAKVREEELRTGVLDVAEPLFRELVDLLASTGDTAGAFEYAERWRARTLLDRLRIRRTTQLPALRHDEAIIEYVILKDRLLIFSITRDGLTQHSASVSRERLRQAISQFLSAIRSGTSDTTAAAAAHDVLLAPTAGALRNVKTVTFVPDGFLQGVPFAALYDSQRERFLIEDRAVAVSPSAQLRTRFGGVKSNAVNDVFVIGDPDTSGEFMALLAARREARAVASLYQRRSIAIGAAATAERFLREWGTAKIVHYAGHAASTHENEITMSLALAGNQAASYVSAPQIVKPLLWGDPVLMHSAAHPEGCRYLPASKDNVPTPWLALCDSTLTSATQTARLSLRGTSVLHFAAHGNAGIYPLFSKAVAPPAAQLVVLAACETFTGRDEHLEGTPTLAHAFLAAGVPTVVGTLWKIEDDDALFTEFHRHVARGVPFGEALRRAQLLLLANGRQPGAWAGVTLVGNPHAAFETSRASSISPTLADAPFQKPTSPSNSRGLRNVPKTRSQSGRSL